MKRKVAIVSKNKEILHFFALEAEQCGLLPFAFERSVTDLSEYALAFIDTDTVKSAPSLSAEKTFYICADGNGDIEYPIALEALDEILLSISRPHYKGHSAGNETKRENKLIFFEGIVDSVEYRGRSIMLSEREYATLELLCKNAYTTVSREELYGVFGGDIKNVVDVYIHKLRQKLEVPFGVRIISTQRSKGYKISVDTEWI